jgi:Ca-activated chloride channel family protein
MKKLLVFIAILLLAVVALAGCGQSAETLNNKGNEAFADQDYDGALTAYLGAQEDAPEMAEPHYNAANSHYRMEDYQQAQQEIEQALVGEESQGALDQNSYYNLGNNFFQAQQFQPAIEAYKEALRLNPDDLQAKQNLELAMRQLQEQEQEQQEQEQEDQADQGSEQEQSDDPSDEQQDQESEQEQQSDDQADQRSDDQESEQDQESDDEGQAEGQPQQITGLTEEQARQLLEAAAEGAESLEEFLQQILVFPGGSPLEDW